MKAKTILTLALISALLLSCSTKKITTKTDITDKTITSTDSSSVKRWSESSLIDLSKRITITEHITETIAEVKDSTGRIVSPARTITKKKLLSTQDNNISISERDSCSSEFLSVDKRADVVSSTTEVVRRSSFSWVWVCFWVGVLVVIGVGVRRWFRLG